METYPELLSQLNDISHSSHQKPVYGDKSKNTTKTKHTAVQLIPQSLHSCFYSSYTVK